MWFLRTASYYRKPGLKPGVVFVVEEKKQGHRLVNHCDLHNSNSVRLEGFEPPNGPILRSILPGWEIQQNTSPSGHGLTGTQDAHPRRSGFVQDQQCPVPLFSILPIHGSKVYAVGVTPRS